MRRIRGFTLVELLGVVAMIGILLALAIPGYNRYVQRANRAAAQSVMSDIVNKEQIYLQTARQYGLLTDMGYTVPSNVSQNYAITVAPAAGPPPTFLVTATPTAGQAADGWLTIDQDNTKNSQYPNKW